MCYMYLLAANWPVTGVNWWIIITAAPSQKSNTYLKPGNNRKSCTQTNTLVQQWGADPSLWQQVYCTIALMSSIVVLFVWHTNDLMGLFNQFAIINPSTMRWYSNLNSIPCKNRFPNLSLQTSFVHPPLLWVQGSFLVEKKDESLHPCINFRVSLNIHLLDKLQIFQLFHRLSQNLCNHICCWTIFTTFLSLTAELI